MSSDLVTRIRKGDSAKEAADEIELLESRIAIYENALKTIRDQTFEQSNSPRIIDQLWHFVRWAKSVARDALENNKISSKSTSEIATKDG
tara:strand:+ start:716 stop:985 length:270 start_codon:yes stop_codon:yes gene_type:complete